MRTYWILWYAIGAVLVGSLWLPIGAVGKEVAEAAPDELERLFGHPPEQAKLRVYAWHWINGHVTKAGITTDLENMARAGFAGAIIYHVGNRASDVKHKPFISEVGPAAGYLDETHLSLLRHAADEARRLGLQLGMHAGAGWSGAGGPWITPKHAYKHLNLGEYRVSGGKTFTWRRPVLDPEKGEGFVGIVAFRIPAAELASGQPVKIPFIDEKRGAKGLWNLAHNSPPDPAQRAIPAADMQPVSPEAVIPRTDVVDLTPQIGHDGTLTWNVPEGQWIVLVAAYTYGRNGLEMAMPSGAGMDCDRLDPAALECHWKHGIQPVLDRLGEHVGTTFRYIQLDSHETGNHTWAADFPQRFEKLHGYSLLPWLPVLTGRIVGSAQQSERFLRDYRKTLEVGANEAFAATMVRKCRQHGLQFVLQPYDRGTFGALSMGAVEGVLLQCEFWMGGGEGLWKPNPNRRSGSIGFVPSIAHTTGKNLVTAESFTSYLAHYGAERMPLHLKLVGDNAWCDGVNAFWLHEVAHNPYPQLRPGMYFGIWGVNFNPNALPWREQMKAWADYVARSQALLQAGRHVADFLVHDPSDLGVTLPVEFPFGYRYDLAHDDIILQLRVQDGRLSLPSGQRYAALVLPSEYNHFNYRRFTPEVLAHIARLVQDGAQVLGLKPLSAWTLRDEANTDKVFRELSAALWKGYVEGTKGQNTYGKGKVWWGYAPDQWARETGLLPDFGRPENTPVEFIHRRHDATDTDWYFVANQDFLKPIEAEFAFRVTGKVPELWDAVSGTIRPAPVWREDKGQTFVRLSLPPVASVFVVFRRGVTNSDPLVSFTRLKPFTGTVDSQPVVLPGGQPGVLAFESGRFSGQTKAGKEVAAELTVPAPVPLVRPWTLQFDSQLGGPDKPVVFDKLISLHEHNDPKIKYYSGSVAYKQTISIPPEFVGDGKRLMLDLGQVRELAEIRMNGRVVAVAWCPPFAVDITGAVRPGPNELEIVVVNGWRNRWIGDEQLPPDVATVTPAWAGQKPRSPIAFPDWAKQGGKSPNGRILFSTFMPHTKDDPLVPAGLLGPVTLRCGVLAELSAVGRTDRQ